MTATETKISLKNKLLGNGEYFVINASSSHPLLLTEHAAKWTGRSAVEVNIENERFTVVCSHQCENLQFGNFTLYFGRLHKRIVLKWMAHMHHNNDFKFPHPINQMIVFWCSCCCCRCPCL